MGHLDCLHLLLLCGASATARNADGDSPVDLAATKKHYSCVTLLRRHLNYAPRADGTSPDSRRTSGQTSSITPSPLGPPPCDSPLLHPSTVLEVPSTTSESDPFAGTGSSSEAGQALAGMARAAEGYPPMAATPGTGADFTAGAANVTPSRAHRRGRRSAGRPPHVEYVGHSEDSDLDEVAEAIGHEALADSDSGGGSSVESSEESPPRRGASGRGGRGRRRERSPVAFGLLNRMQLGLRGAKRWFSSGPVQADLGIPNRYRFNDVTKRWELPDGGEDD